MHMDLTECGLYSLIHCHVLKGIWGVRESNYRVYLQSDWREGKQRRKVGENAGGHGGGWTLRVR